MKILITGAKGMLAQDIIKRFNDEELILTDVEDLDITNRDAVKNYILDKKPDCIINCAAYTAVDNAESAGEIVKKINADGPENLAIAAKEVDAILVHVSTDYVFGGDLSLDKVYSEEDEKNPVTVYGITKLQGEENIKNNIDKYYIFRTAWLYGIGGKNFVKTMTKLGTDKDELNVVADQYGSPTYTVDLAEYIYQAINKKIPYGVYNATNNGYTTWFDFTKEILKEQNIECKVNPVTTEEYIKLMGVQQAKRPLNSKLSKQKLIDAGIDVPEWKDALKRYLEEK